MRRAVLCCAAAAVAALPLSIAASQILLGMAIVVLLATRTRLRFPRVSIPLGLFLGATVLAVAFSGDPVTGLPQIRKIYVYLLLPVVYSAVRGLRAARAVFLAWTATGTAAAVVGVVQFVLKAREAQAAGRGFYEYYVANRITGFTSNWQTYGGEQMILVVLLVSFLMFSPAARGALFWAGLAAAALLGATLLLGYTRGAWLGAGCAVSYLVWFRKRTLLIAIPALIALVLWLNPGAVRQRFESAFVPDKALDSNEFRIVCWRTGWRMIREHPVLGLGPEIVRAKFLEYVPADIRRPLPAGWYGHLHNVYLHYAAERGIPAVLALVSALLLMLVDFGRALGRLKPGQSDERFLLHGGIAVTVAVMISGIFEVNLGDSEVLAMFLAAAALGYVAREQVRHA